MPSTGRRLLRAIALAAVLAGCTAPPGTPAAPAGHSRSTPPGGTASTTPTPGPPSGVPSQGVPTPEQTSTPALSLTATSVPARVSVCTQTGPGACDGYPSGSSIQYSLTLRNTTSSRMSGPAGGPLTVTARLTRVLTHLKGRWTDESALRVCTVHATLDPVQVICAVGPLAPGATAVVTILATVTAPPASGVVQAAFLATAQVDGRLATASTATSTAVGAIANGA